jgi:hypothetical protein
MKLIITEGQYNELLVNKSVNENFKPAEFFDKIYGTNLAQKYNFSPLTEKIIWKSWLKCRDTEDCEDFYMSFHFLPKIFPYVDYSNIDSHILYNIMHGVLSGFNTHDIIRFSVNKIPYWKNTAQKKLEKQLPEDVLKNINWVLSPHTIKIIKKRFSIE